jgi:YggT family protein
MSKADILEFLNAVFLIFYILIIIRIVFSWIGIPSQKALFMIFKFSYDATEWYLGIFRRFIPTAGMIDLSPIIAIIVLRVIQSIAFGLIRDM